jgi:hypothetical protein
MINLFAVLLAALAAFVLGFLFHGPVAGNLWMKLADIHPTGNEKFSDMYGQLFWNFVVNFVTAFILAVIYLFASTSSLITSRGALVGIMCGLLVWIGFQVTITSIPVIWMKQPVKLWLFEVVSALIVFTVMGAIIGAMS